MARPSTEQIGTAIASVLAEANVSQSELSRRLTARGWTVDQSRVSRWVRGVGEPHALAIYPAIEQECAAPLGTIFRRAGYVEEATGFDVAAAIAADPALDEDGRNALTVLYEVLKTRAGTGTGQAGDGRTPAVR